MHGSTECSISKPHVLGGGAIAREVTSRVMRDIGRTAADEDALDDMLVETVYCEQERLAESNGVPNAAKDREHIKALRRNLAHAHAGKKRDLLEQRDRRKTMLDDIAVLTGGRVVTEETGSKLEHMTEAQLGRAQRVIVTRDTTTIVGGAGDRELIAARTAELRRQITDAKSDYDREKLEERLAKLSGGVAVIRVGAASESELKNRKEAYDDAISATKAAIAEGIVPGAGLALLRLIENVEEEVQRCEGDERTGLKIFARALEAPTRQIATNSEADAGVVVERMRAGKGSYGFDAGTARYVKLFDVGVIDPSKVVRVALQNAVSVASVLLLAEATMTEIPEGPTAHEEPSGMHGME